MIRTFELKKGTIVFDEEKIIIKDKSQSQRNLWLYLSLAGVVIGVLFVLDYLISGNELLLWIGLFYSGSHIAIFFAILMGPLQNEILLKEVKSLKLKKKYGNNVLEIKLQNNKIRRVSRIENPVYLQQFIEIVLNHRWNLE
jgi:hypothetical protein